LLINSAKNQITFRQHSSHITENRFYIVTPIHDNTVLAAPEVQKLAPTTVNQHLLVCLECHHGCVISANVADHRRRACGAQNETEASSRRSVHLLC
jgi:hypothetical protein